MLKIISIFCLIMSLTVSIFSQPVIDELSIQNDISDVSYEQKNVRLATTMSAILPGSGAMYVNPKRWISYLFPVIEGLLIYSYISGRQEATDSERDYEKYVNGEIITITDPQTGNIIYSGPRYNRILQNEVQSFVSDVNTSDIYDVNGQNGFYRLDPENTQHFYEDVGKYKKYIYGWADWYEKYAYSGSGSFEEGYIDPDINWNTDASDNNHIIVGYNIVNNNYLEDEYGGLNTPMRAKYIKMRKDTQKMYDDANSKIYLILLNHTISAIDSGIFANKFNRDQVKNNKIGVNYSIQTFSGRLTPILNLSKRF